MTEIALTAIKDDGYRFGDYQAIRYDRKSSIFPEDVIGELYLKAKQSGRRSTNGVLDALFSGNPESHFDAVVPYLATHPLIIMGEWDGDRFQFGGFAFVSIICGTAETERSAFCGYTIFRRYWGTDEAKILSILGLTALFQEFNLIAIHGIRYEENLLTERFVSQFGFKETGRIPHYQLKDGKLVPGIVTTLLRSEFEEFLEQWLADAWRQANG